MSVDVRYNPKPKGKPMSKKRWSEKLIENAATSNVILSRQEWDSLIEGIRSLEAELESARRDRGLGWDKFASRLEAVSDRKRLESENAELRQTITNAGTLALQRDNEIKNLREKLAAAEKERDDADDACRCKSLELARYKSSDEAEQCETCEGTGKVETCAEYEFPGTPEKDCPDCSVKPEAERWAVTCDGMTEACAARLVHNCHKFFGNTPTMKAVPLAPEDGPWAICRVTQDLGSPTTWYYAREGDNIFHASKSGAIQYKTQLEATKKIVQLAKKEPILAYCRTVRLADVERESGKPDA